MIESILVFIKFIIGVCFLFFIFLFFTPSESRYVGSSACFQCHKEEYTIWSGSKHASSFESLAQAEQKKYYCLKCHTTDGAEHLAGFKIKNVECEACHVMGEKHIEAHTLQDKALIAQSKMKIENPHSLCLRCHDDNQSISLEKFIYETKWRIIAHGKNTQKP